MEKQNLIGTILLIIMMICAGLFGLMMLYVEPYKETCLCTTDYCTVSRYYPNFVDTGKYSKNDIQFSTHSGHGGRYVHISYSIQPIFESRYYIRFRAESDYNTILSSQANITKWNIFLPALVILLGFLMPIPIIKNLYEEFKLRKLINITRTDSNTRPKRKN